MSTNEQQGLIFTARITHPSSSVQQYARGIIEVRSELWQGDPLVTFEWQAHKREPGAEQYGMAWKEGWSDWYVFRINISANGLENLNHATRITRAIMRPFAKEYRNSLEPVELAERLTTMRNCIEAVYDPRMSSHVPLDEIRPDSESRYIDEYSVIGQDSATQSCLASSADEARALIAAALAADPRKDDILMAFIAAGRPVREVDRGAPDTTPATVKFRPDPIE